VVRSWCGGGLAILAVLGWVASAAADEQQVLQWEREATALRMEGRPEDAARLLRRALREDPQSTSARASLAETYLQMGNQNLAFATIAEGMKIEAAKPNGQIGLFTQLMQRLDMAKVDAQQAAAEAELAEIADEAAELAAAPPAEPAAQARPAAADDAPWVAVSTASDAMYPSLACGPDGRWHAAWRDKLDGELWPRAFYSASTDGRAWSRPEPLTRGTRDDSVDVVKLVLGRSGPMVFVTHPPAGDIGPSGYSQTNLFAFAGGPGAWGQPIRVGEVDGVFGWFATAGADGRVHVVWSHDQQERYHQPSEAGTISTAVVAGGAVTGRRTLVSHAVERSPGTIRTTGYSHLSGLVDPAGRVHWLAMRQDFETGTVTATRLQLGADGTEQSLGEVTDRGAWTLWMPMLLPDAAGRLHVVFYSRSRREGPAMMDVLPYENEPPRVIFEPAAGLEFIRCDVVAVNGGGLVLGVIADRDGSRDLYVATSDGETWSGLQNVTANAARTRFDDRLNQAALTRFSARSMAAARGPDGRLALLMHHGQTTYVEGLAAYGGHVVDRLYLGWF